ncbi:MAG TPA: histidine phosphatase family protein [Caulobacteraceae bacterium]|jgi:broad specificity phosphatase PhoE|nr:histidine phosphatase family protein [Caulobacteraceae bacterium]
MADRAVADLTDAVEKPGAVILARHGKPALSRRCRLSASEYREWWADYEVGGLAEGQAAPETLQQHAQRAGFIIASTRLRSIETATALAAGRAFAEDPLFIEAPLPPPHWPHWLKLSPPVWGFISRTWWWIFDHHDQQETREQAKARADDAARTLIKLAASGHDVLVVAHGFFNLMIGRALRRHGWTCTEDGGFKYWAARRFELPQR